MATETIEFDIRTEGARKELEALRAQLDKLKGTLKEAQSEAKSQSSSLDSLKESASSINVYMAAQFGASWGRKANEEISRLTETMEAQTAVMQDVIHMNQKSGASYQELAANAKKASAEAEKIRSSQGVTFGNAVESVIDTSWVEKIPLLGQAVKFGKEMLQDQNDLADALEREAKFAEVKSAALKEQEETTKAMMALEKAKTDYAYEQMTDAQKLVELQKEIRQLSAAGSSAASSGDKVAAADYWVKEIEAQKKYAQVAKAIADDRKKQQEEAAKKIAENKKADDEYAKAKRDYDESQLTREQQLVTLKKQLVDLEEQRAKALAAGNHEEAANYGKDAIETHKKLDAANKLLQSMGAGAVDGAPGKSFKNLGDFGAADTAGARARITAGRQALGRSDTRQTIGGAASARSAAALRQQQQDLSDMGMTGEADRAGRRAEAAEARADARIARNQARGRREQARELTGEGFTNEERKAAAEKRQRLTNEANDLETKGRTGKRAEQMSKQETLLDAIKTILGERLPEKSS